MGWTVIGRMKNKNHTGWKQPFEQWVSVRQRHNQQRQRQIIDRLNQDNYELVVSLHWDIKTQFLKGFKALMIGCRLKDVMKAATSSFQLLDCSHCRNTWRRSVCVWWTPQSEVKNPDSSSPRTSQRAIALQRNVLSSCRTSGTEDHFLFISSEFPVHQRLMLNGGTHTRLHLLLCRSGRCCLPPSSVYGAAGRMSWRSRTEPDGWATVAAGGWKTGSCQ